MIRLKEKKKVNMRCVKCCVKSSFFLFILDHFIAVFTTYVLCLLKKCRSGVLVTVSQF